MRTAAPREQEKILKKHERCWNNFTTGPKERRRNASEMGFFLQHSLLQFFFYCSNMPMSKGSKFNLQYLLQPSAFVPGDKVNDWNKELKSTLTKSAGRNESRLWMGDEGCVKLWEYFFGQILTAWSSIQLRGQTIWGDHGVTQTIRSRQW